MLQADFIKAIYQRFQNGDGMLEAINGVLVGESQMGIGLGEAYGAFALACLLPDDPQHGFADNGRVYAKRPVGYRTPDPDTEDYYVDTATDDSISEAEGELAHLAAHYIKINAPSGLSSQNSCYNVTDLHTVFNRNGTDKWGVYSVDYEYAHSEEAHYGVTKIEIPREDRHKVDDTFGGDVPGNYERQVVVVAQTDWQHAEQKTYKYRAAVEPRFDGDYGPTAGGTKWVRNYGQGDNADGSRKSDNFYKLGDTLEMEVDVSSRAKVTPDFSQLRDYGWLHSVTRVDEQPASWKYAASGFFVGSPQGLW